MQRKTNVLVIGGSAAGVVAATTGRTFYPDKEFLLVRKDKQVLVPCGIPYVFGTLGSTSKNLIPDAGLEKAGVELLIGEVVSLDPQRKTCTTEAGDEISFERAILATGSRPYIPTWLPGVELDNVFAIPKEKESIDRLLDQISSKERVVVIGGGFIGVEMSDELNKAHRKVTLVEKLPHILEAAFDTEFAERAQQVLVQRGVTVISGDGVREIRGEGSVQEVVLEGGRTLKADAVILSMGYRPNTDLARQAGIKVDEQGFVKVNEYMRTSHPDILAVGDCAEKVSFITRVPRPIMLASTACAEARIGAINLYQLRLLKTFGGTIATYSTMIGDLAIGVAGVTEELAKERNFTYVVGAFSGPDHHPGSIPGTQIQTVKLIASRNSGMVIGGQVAGGASTGELVNLISLAIENKMTVASLLTAQFGTHPLLTAPPTAYPLLKAAEDAGRQLWGQGQG